DHTVSLSSFGHEGVVAIPRADVEHRLVGQRRQVQARQIVMVMARRLSSGRHHTIANVDGMVPLGNLGDQPLPRGAIERLHGLLRSWVAHRTAYRTAPQSASGMPIDYMGA